MKKLEFNLAYLVTGATVVLFPLVMKGWSNEWMDVVVNVIALTSFFGGLIALATVWIIKIIKKIRSKRRTNKKSYSLDTGR